ncbi:MAG: site-specific DNA-methyltransferase [Pyrinomonadaceae bacterium]|nr:site-specific DNA-methyltransferase [Phycisphaerales bacterium]
MPPSRATDPSKPMIGKRGAKTRAASVAKPAARKRNTSVTHGSSVLAASLPGTAPVEESAFPASDEKLIPFDSVQHADSGVVARTYVGDCRGIIPHIPECKAGTVDLIFADPPFNWKRAYDEWDDEMTHKDYLDFTYRWLDLCIDSLRPGGSLWVNIPDDWAAEIVIRLKYHASPARQMHMVNWCIWHYRFGQNTTIRFINSKVHALYFVKPGGVATWNADAVLEESDRRAIYSDARTESKNDGMPAGMRVPMDVWYGKYMGRVQGNSKERRGYHDNQLPEMYLARVIRACSNKGDMVMDPFLGSGTTGVVAHALGRHFIGTEFSEKNATSAMDRIRVGPIRDVEGIGQSTAIFGQRGKQRTAGTDSESENDSDDIIPKPKPTRTPRTKQSAADAKASAVTKPKGKPGRARKDIGKETPVMWNT